MFPLLLLYVLRFRVIVKRSCILDVSKIYDNVIHNLQSCLMNV